jgi:hypothetical protein
MNDSAFAVLRANGTVSAWGDAATGGVAPAGLSNVIEVYSTKTAFAALKKDGTVVAWGLAGNGGTAPAGLSNVARIFSTASAFAALKKDGTVVTWGDGAAGGVIPAGANVTNVREIFSNRSAFAAVKQDGTVVAWGNAAEGGNLATPLANVATIVSTWTAFAALRTDGTAFSWGSQAEGGNLPDGYLTGTVARIFSTRAAFVALKTDGTVQGWGDGGHGSVPPSGLSGVADIVGAERAFAALKSDGTVVAWGDSRYGGSGVPAGLANVQALYSNSYAFAALRTDGTVVPWGLNTAGGSTSSATIGGSVVRVYTTERAFAALKSNGTVFAWGDSGYGGTGMPAGLANVDQVLGNQVAFAVLRTDGTLAAWGNAARGGGTTPTPGDHLALQGVVVGRPWFAPGMATTLTALSGADQAFSLGARGLDLRHSVSAGALPTGMVLEAATGALTGKPTATGNFAFTVKAENGIGSRVLDFLVVVNQAPAITSADKITFTVGTSGSFTATASGFPAPTFSIASGSLPSGITLSAGGVLSGTPAAGTGGTYALTLKAANSIGTDATQNFTLTVNQAPAITSADKITFTVGTAGSFTATASGFPAPTFSIASGSLPSGVTLSAGGVLSGTPAAGTGGTYALTLKAANGIGTDATQNFTLTVNQAPAITSADKITFTVGTSGSYSATATGFPAPTFSLASGTLPDGITLSAQGVLSGRASPGTGGTHALTLKASNGVGTDATQSFTLTVQEAPVLLGASSRSFRTGVASAYQFTALGFPAPVFSVRGTLPAGVTLGTDGLLSGTPPASAQGTYTFTVVAGNGLAPDATKDFTLAVTNGPAITSPDRAIFRVGQQKSFQVTATGTPAPTFTLAGTLPQGLSFSPAGVLSGTPAAGTSGSHSLSITAANGVLPDDTQPFTLVIQEVPAITSAGQATFPAGQSGSFQMTATGYPVPVFSVASGSLPAGLSLSASGLLSGSPAAGTGGAYPLTVKAGNGVGTDATQSFTLTVTQAPAITSASSATFTTGRAGSFTATATGYPIPTFSLASGSLPAGVSLSSSGLISGTPSATAGGRHLVTLKATNGVSPEATQSFTLSVNQAPAITSGDGATFTVGQAGTYQVVASGFPAPTFSVASGSLPDGVTLSAAGLLSGTPAAGSGGIYRFAVQAANGVGNGATQAFTLTVNQGLAITSANQAIFTVGQAGSFTVTATGNPVPVFSLASGALPSGLSLTGGGALSGTPAAGTGGTYSLVLRAANGIGGEVTQPFTLTVRQAPAFTSAAQASFTIGKSGSQALTATGYPAPVFSVHSGTLPNGIALTADGKLQGVALPGSLGSYAIQVRAENAAGSALLGYTVSVGQEGVFSVAAMGGGTELSRLAIYRNGTRELLREVIPFPGFKGEFYADSGDISGDGVEDIIVGSGKGSQNGHVVVFDGAVLLNPKAGKAVELPYSMGGSVRASLYAFVGYSSGVAVRLADLNDDGFDDIAMAPGTGAGTKTHAHLRVWNGKDSMADFEAGKPLPYDYRWEMASFWAFGEGSNPGGGMALSVIRQAGPDLIVASQLFGGGSKVLRYDGQKVLTTVLDMTGWKDLFPSGNTVVGFDRGGVRYFANGGTDPAAPDTVFVRTGSNQAAYTIDRVFGGTPGGLRLGLANMDADAEDELLVIRGTDSTTKVFDLFADKAALIDTLKPGGRSGWV